MVFLLSIPPENFAHNAGFLPKHLRAQGFTGFPAGTGLIQEPGKPGVPFRGVLLAVPSDGDKKKEVTWEEHIHTQMTIQKWIDSGVSKTINFPAGTHRETIAKSFMLAWELGCKGVTVYRNGSRDVEVLTPKNVQKNLCPACEAPTKKFDGCTSCTECEWSLCTV